MLNLHRRGNVVCRDFSISEAGYRLTWGSVTTGIEGDAVTVPLESRAFFRMGVSMDHAEFSQDRTPVPMVRRRRKETRSAGVPRPPKIDVGAVLGVGPPDG